MELEVNFGYYMRLGVKLGFALGPVFSDIVMFGPFLGAFAEYKIKEKLGIGLYGAYYWQMNNNFEKGIRNLAGVNNAFSVGIGLIFYI